MASILGKRREILEQEFRLAGTPGSEQGQGLRGSVGEQGENALGEFAALEMPRISDHWPTLAMQKQLFNNG